MNSLSPKQWKKQRIMEYSIADCPGWVPGMALSQDICERCGGHRYDDHQPNKRNASTGDRRNRFNSSPQPAAPGNHANTVTYPCGCVAKGDGSVALPETCPNHPPETFSFLGDAESAGAEVKAEAPGSPSNSEGAETD